MAKPSNQLTIGAFARVAGVNVETIRFYQRKGLLAEPQRPSGSIRRYGEADVARLRFIKSTQRLGFNLEEIAQLLKLEDGAHCSEIAEVAAQRLADVRSRVADFIRMEEVLSELVSLCHREPDTRSCPLIRSLQEGTNRP